MKIKQIQWKEGYLDGSRTLLGETPICDVKVIWSHDNDNEVILYGSLVTDRAEFTSAEEAKQAAQQAFENKVKECLEFYV